MPSTECMTHWVSFVIGRAGTIGLMVSEPAGYGVLEDRAIPIPGTASGNVGYGRMGGGFCVGGDQCSRVTREQNT